VINFQKLWDKSGTKDDEYARQYPQYIKTNEKLVSLVDVRPGQVIVDLACGTWMTTEAVLKTCPNVRKVYAVDFSEDMLRVAKTRIKAENVAFIHADATDLVGHFPEKVDLALCNSSFWQFDDRSAIIRAIRTVLKDGGIFVFNLNQQFYDFGAPEANQKVIIDAIYEEMRKRGFEVTGGLKEKMTKEEIEELFASAGFTLAKTARYDVGPRSLDDFLNFFTIPATATFFEKVPERAARNPEHSP